MALFELSAPIPTLSCLGGVTLKPAFHKRLPKMVVDGSVDDSTLWGLLDESAKDCIAPEAEVRGPRWQRQHLAVS